VAAWATTLGVGIGAGFGAAIGTGYVVFTKRATPARIESLKAIDEAYRETIAAKLEASLERNARCEERYKECCTRQDQMDADMQALRTDLEAERARAQKAVEDLTIFATGILKARGYLEHEGEPEPAPEPRLTPDPNGNAA
jgi:hypothetical protein